MRKISESTVRRLSLYLRFLEQFDAQGQTTISSAELARRGGTTSAQVRKDLSFFRSFGKRGLGYSVPELTARIRDILGLRRTYRVVLVGAGRIGSALVQYPGSASVASTSRRSTTKTRRRSAPAGTASCARHPPSRRGSRQGAQRHRHRRDPRRVGAGGRGTGWCARG